MKILIVTRETKIGQFIKSGLQEFQFEVESSADHSEALALTGEGQYDLVVLDEDHSERFDVNAAVREFLLSHRKLAVVVLSNGNAQRIATKVNHDLVEYVLKPFEFRLLLGVIISLRNKQYAHLKNTDPQSNGMNS